MTDRPRRLVLVLGDQLTLDSPALKGLDAAHDRVLMIEAPGEATEVWSHKARIGLVLSSIASSISVTIRTRCGQARRSAGIRCWPAA
ncbi:MAG: cryptochrome/photolyase family protein [Burkholderiaceae bacterium]|nr:cryptochrome/photolyase family protein [Burkholderiaceae bacterium]